MSKKSFNHTSVQSILNPAKSLKENGFKKTWKASSDPGDFLGGQQKVADKKQEIKDTAAANAVTDKTLGEMRSRMLPNSPLNTFRPFVNTQNQPAPETGRLPPNMGDGQYDPNMLRAMISQPDYGQMADQQWQAVRQQAPMQQPGAPMPQQQAPIPQSPMMQPNMNQLPNNGSAAPAMTRPTPAQLQMFAMQQRNRAQ